MNSNSGMLPRVPLWSGVACLLVTTSAPLAAQQPTLSRTLAAGSGPVHVAFSPDGKVIASGAGDELTLWEVATGKNAATLKGQAGAWALAFSPDGKALAAAGGIGSFGATPVENTVTHDIKLWDVATAELTTTLAGHTGVVWSVAFSPDGKTLVSCSQDGTVRLWDVATGKTTATLQAHTVFLGSVTFSPDGETVVSGGGPVVIPRTQRVSGEIKLWDAVTRWNTATLEAHLGKGCFSNMFAVAFSVTFSPDGKTLASAGSNTIELWDVATGRNIATLSCDDGELVLAVAFSPDGKTVAAGSATLGVPAGKEQPPPGKIRLVDVATRKITATLNNRPGGVWSVALSADGKTLASGEGEGTCTLWSIP